MFADTEERLEQEKKDKLIQIILSDPNSLIANRTEKLDYDDHIIIFGSDKCKLEFVECSCQPALTRKDHNNDYRAKIEYNLIWSILENVPNKSEEVILVSVGSDWFGLTIILAELYKKGYNNFYVINVENFTTHYRVIQRYKKFWNWLFSTVQQPDDLIKQLVEIKTSGIDTLQLSADQMFIFAEDLRFTNEPEDKYEVRYRLILSEFITNCFNAKLALKQFFYTTSIDGAVEKKEYPALPLITIPGSNLLKTNYNYNTCLNLLQMSQANTDDYNIYVLFCDADTFSTRLLDLINASDQKNPIVFIAKLNESINHFICGVASENKLILIDPLGIYIDETTDIILKTLGKTSSTLPKIVYLSSHPLQNIAFEGDCFDSSGPIAVEMAIHILTNITTKNINDFLITVSTTDTIGITVHQTGKLVYITTQINDLLPDTFTSLLNSNNQDDYRKTIIEMCIKHLEQLKTFQQTHLYATCEPPPGSYKNNMQITIVPPITHLYEQMQVICNTQSTTNRLSKQHVRLCVT